MPPLYIKLYKISLNPHIHDIFPTLSPSIKSELMFFLNDFIYCVMYCQKRGVQTLQFPVTYGQHFNLNLNLEALLRELSLDRQ